MSIPHHHWQCFVPLSHSSAHLRRMLCWHWALCFLSNGLLLHPVHNRYLALGTKDLRLLKMTCQHPSSHGLYLYSYFRALYYSSQWVHSSATVVKLRTSSCPAPVLPNVSVLSSFLHLCLTGEASYMSHAGRSHLDYSLSTWSWMILAGR